METENCSYETVCSSSFAYLEVFSSQTSPARLQQSLRGLAWQTERLMTVKKGEIYEGIVQGCSFPNKGYVRVEEEQEPVLVKNVLPGQRISFRLSKRRHGRYEGSLISVLASGPDELPEPDCPHAGICGGCIYRTLPYEKQLKLKQEQVLSLLRPVLPEADRLFEGIKESPRRTGYRNKMEYTFGDEYKDGPLSLGMHKRGAFYDIVPVTDCRIADADFGRILKGTRDFFAARNVPHYHRVRHTGYLRHLLVRKAACTGEILVDLVTTGGLAGADRPEPAADMADSAETACPQQELLREWCGMLLTLPLDGRLAGVLHTVNNGVADTIRDEGTEVLAGQDFFTETCLGLSFVITPFSFFQTNTAGAEVLYETARRYIMPALEEKQAGRTGAAEQAKTVFDLYSGTGTIAQILAPAARRVIGVEIVPEAAEAAKRNAEKNGLTNCSFLTGDVLKVLDEIEEKPDLIVLDPPRDGVHPKALKKIIEYGVASILYISCKPTSLARDLVALQEGGYRVRRFCCADMFPATANIETIALLNREAEVTADDSESFF